MSRSGRLADIWQQHLDSLDTSSSSGSGGSGSKHRLPWASGLSLPCAAAMQELGSSPPPEVRVKLRLQNHIQLHVRTEQTLQRAQAAERELTLLLGSTPLLQGGAGGWEGELAQAYLNLVKARAQLGLLQGYEEHFTNELHQLKEIKAITEDKDRDVKQQVGAAGWGPVGEAGWGAWVRTYGRCKAAAVCAADGMRRSCCARRRCRNHACSTVGCFPGMPCISWQLRHAICSAAGGSGPRVN